MASIRARLDRIKKDPTVLIDPAAVERACREAGHRWRNRTLDPLSTLRAFALQVAHGNTALGHVVRLMGGAFSESAYCQARRRVPVAVVQAALDAFTGRVGGGRDGLWLGHRAVLIDGTGIHTPDTPELREVFGTRGGAAPGLPMVHVLAVFDAHDGLLLGMHTSRAATHDLRHAHDLHPALAAGDVLVGDRGLCAYTHLAALAEKGCHGVFRVSSGRAMPFPAKRGRRTPLGYNRHRRSEPLLVELVSEDDQVVEIVKPHNRPKHITSERFAAIPAAMVVRAVRYTASGPGVRTRRITLLTTLTDARKYPAAALAELYLTRWRIEINFRHLKRTMGMDRLRCCSADGVRRELLMYALVYNAVCHARARAAASLGVPPTRISFVDTLRSLLVGGFQRRTVIRETTDPKLWPLRPPRVHPRMLKLAHSHFRIMKQPRTEIIAWITNNRTTAN